MAKPILLVEDFEEDAALLLRTFKRLGVGNAVFAVRTGEQAICYLKGEGVFSDRERFPMPSVMLLDLKLTGINGFEVLKWLTTQPDLSKLFVVVLSGHDEIGHIGRAYAHGARSFLVKPVTDLDFQNLMRGFPGYWISVGGYVGS